MTRPEFPMIKDTPKSLFCHAQNSHVCRYSHRGSSIIQCYYDISRKPVSDQVKSFENYVHGILPCKVEAPISSLTREIFLQMIFGTVNLRVKNSITNSTRKCHFHRSHLLPSTKKILLSGIWDAEIGEMGSFNQFHFSDDSTSSFKTRLAERGIKKDVKYAQDRSI